MLLPLKWLKEFVDYQASAQDLAEALTMVGLEVEAIIERLGGLKAVKVCRVNAVHPHPQAERLHLAEVTTGQDGFTLVCGAPNLKEGMLAALALPGAELAEGL